MVGVVSDKMMEQVRYNLPGTACKTRQQQRTRVRRSTGLIRSIWIAVVVQFKPTEHIGVGKSGTV
jgi:hypothetical protein